MPALANPYRNQLSHLRLRPEPLPEQRQRGGALQRRGEGLRRIDAGDRLLEEGAALKRAQAERYAPSVQGETIRGETIVAQNVSRGLELQANVTRLQQEKEQRQRQATATIRKTMPVFTSDYFSSLTNQRKVEIVNGLLEAYSASAAPGQFELFAQDEEFPADYIEEIRPRIKKIWGSKELSFGRKMQEIKAIIEETPGTGGDIAEQRANEQVGQTDLDAATAQQILQEAGGDKNAARELARQRGFTF